MNPADRAPSPQRLADLQEYLLQLLADPALQPQLAEASLRHRLLRRLLGRSACEQLGIFELPSGFLLSVIIPVYNEAATVQIVVERVSDSGVPCEIILVDDGSTDGTGEIVERLASERGDVVLLKHARNRGKGAALQTGFAAARGDIVVVQDADLEYDPADFWRLIQPIVSGHADVVYGSRFRGDSQRALYFWHYLGNKLITLLSNMNTNLNLSDVETGYKLFRRELIQSVAPHLRENGFGIEPEITARVAKISGTRFYEVPISYDGRTYAEGKKIGWRDGVRAVYCILRY